MRGDITLDAGFFRTLVEATASGILYVSPGGYIVYANPRAAVLAGVPTPTSLVGMCVEGFFLPEERQRMHAEITILHSEGVYRLAEHEVQRVDGSRFSADISASVLRDREGQLSGYTAVVRDISSHKSLRDSFTLLFERNPLPMWVYDARTLRFLEVNRAATEHYGYSREEFLSLTIADIRPPEELPRLREHVAQERPPIQRSSEWRHRTKNGSIREVDIFSHTLTFQNRDAVLVVVQDVTEHRHVEEQLRQAQKMEAVGRLAGGIAHDFNNLLTAILGYCELLLNHRGLPDALRSDVQEIEGAGQSAATLTQQLLAFSRKQIVHPRIIDANALLDRTRALLQRILGEDINLEFRQATPLPPILIDPGQFDQIVMNLAVNARDAMPRGGRLTIETAIVGVDDLDAGQHSDVRPGPHVMLAVTDTGTGIPPDVQAHIFEPFFTTKPQGRGTGLGLSTVFGIVKQNDGNICVYSEPGRGTTFKVYFPAVDGAHPETRVEQRGQTPAGSETILLVEDDARLRTLAKRALESFGYTVIVAAEAKDAIDIARTHPGAIDALVTDVVLPNINGRVLASVIGELRPDAKVLFMSGYTADTIVHHGVVDAGTYFLRKPFTPDVLAAKVRAVLDEPDRGN